LSVSGSSWFNPRERVPITLWTGGWVGLRTSLDALAKRKISLHCPSLELNRGGPARRLVTILTEPLGLSQSLFILLTNKNILLLSLPLLPLERWGVCPISRLPLLLRITIYSRQVISLALEARCLGQLVSQYLYPLGSPGGPAIIPPGTGCSF
jgi:hypothetical protein